MDKKAIIQHSAELLFATKGYHGTSIRDIAKYSDVNVAMITYYFKSKENLLLSIIQKLNDASVKIINEINSSESDAKKMKVFTCKSQEEFQKYSNACKIVMQLHMLDINLKVNTAIKRVKEKHYKSFLLATESARQDQKWHLKKKYLYYVMLGFIWDDICYDYEDYNTDKNQEALNISNFLCNYLTTIIQFNFKTNES